MAARGSGRLLFSSFFFFSFARLDGGDKHHSGADVSVKRSHVSGLEKGTGERMARRVERHDTPGGGARTDRAAHLSYSPWEITTEVNFVRNGL